MEEAENELIPDPPSTTTTKNPSRSTRQRFSLTTKAPEVSSSKPYSKSKRPGRKQARSTTVAPITPTTTRRSISSYATKSSTITTISESQTTPLKQETTVLFTSPTSSTTKQKYHARFNAGAETKAQEKEITPSSNGFSKIQSTKPPRGYHSDRKKEKVNGRQEVSEKPVQKSNKYIAESQQVYIN